MSGCQACLSLKQDQACKVRGAFQQLDVCRRIETALGGTCSDTLVEEDEGVPLVGQVAVGVAVAHEAQHGLVWRHHIVSLHTAGARQRTWTVVLARVLHQLQPKHITKHAWAKSGDEKGGRVPTSRRSARDRCLMGTCIAMMGRCTLILRTSDCEPRCKYCAESDCVVSSRVTAGSYRDRSRAS
jgi:hypothetical protein